MRLACLLLSLCVLGASVGAPLTERLCLMSGQLLVSFGQPATASGTDDCCADEPAPRQSPDPADAGCCAVAVAYYHVAPDATGPVFHLDWPTALPASLPLAFGRPFLEAAGTAGPPACRLHGADSSPPGEATGRTLVLALHQLRV